MPLSPWYSIATPHADIRAGRLSQDVFAANLWLVAQDAPGVSAVYRDPQQFFETSYLTEGLASVAGKVARALRGDADAGDRILSLQTSFGGGKTHTLVALYHLARHAQTLADSTSPAVEALRAKIGELPPPARVAVFTNGTCDATQGRVTEDGIHTRTLWGELAAQLGGRELYSLVEANDRALTVPQGIFGEVLKRAAPCLILLDEIADYCVGASAVGVGATTLADQTISFIQHLSEAVQSTPGVALVATLPASHLEVASSEKGQELLDRLEKRLGRMAADLRPVADNEIYEVVRRRLFENLGNEAERRKVARAFAAMYAAHAKDVPSEVTRETYAASIESAYPFHPSLIDAFYLRWGSHSDFQRTRGVLQLLASVVADSWNKRNSATWSQPLLMPGHLNWALDAPGSMLTRLWGGAYSSVVAADVTGERAIAPQLDGERGGDYNSERVAEGLAAATLLGSFGGQAERAGWSAKELRVAVARPDLNWNALDGALLELPARAFYLHSAGADANRRYWFGTKPTLTNLIVQYRHSLGQNNFEKEMGEALDENVRARRAGSGNGSGEASWNVLSNPGCDLAEQKKLTLCVLGPEYTHGEGAGGPAGLPSGATGQIKEISHRCASRERLYRNTLVFLVPSTRGLAPWRAALREVFALEGVRRDYGSQLESASREDLERRIAQAHQKALSALCSAYIYVARVHVNAANGASAEEVEWVTLSDIKGNWAEHLEAVWRHLVDEEEWILRRVGQVELGRVGLIPSAGESGIRLKDAIEVFERLTDKPMIADAGAVTRGLTIACEDGAITLGRGANASALQKSWCRANAPLDGDTESWWILPPILPDAPQTAATPTDNNAQTGVPSNTPPTLPGLTPDSSAANGSATDGTPATSETNGNAASATDLVKVSVAGTVPLESWSELFRCFVSPGARIGRPKLSIELSFKAPDGKALDADAKTLANMREAAKQLGLKWDEQ